MSDYLPTRPLPLSTPSLPVLVNNGKQKNKKAILLFMGLLVLGCVFTGSRLFADVQHTGLTESHNLLLLLPAIALFVALGFEFINGFHDTANAVATVIYTGSLPPTVAVVWSSAFNFLGVLASSGAVAFGIISLLPVELTLQAGSSNSFAMIYALLFSAIIWNLGTWWLGLPASSSHTLIGSIIGVGVANALLHGRSAASGVNWAQALNIGYSLILSPIVGFVCAALLLMLLKRLVKKPQLYRAPERKGAPPLWIRGLMVLTCTGVSFAHGSNDGQKGMGRIMLILVATLPVTYSLNRSLPASTTSQLVTLAETSKAQLLQQFPEENVQPPREVLATYLRDGQRTSKVIPALAQIEGMMAATLHQYGSLSDIPAAKISRVHNDLYLAAETIKRLEADKTLMLSAATQQSLHQLQQHIDAATQFIPSWVKIAVALALGLGTLVGWRRIVTTLGEKIGKSHLNYAQGVSAELVTMGTIGAADAFGLPVSTTHVLSSGIAGAMAANRSGLQSGTLRNMILAWVLTLPAAALISAGLYWIFITL